MQLGIFIEAFESFKLAFRGVVRMLSSVTDELRGRDEKAFE